MKPCYTDAVKTRFGTILYDKIRNSGKTVEEFAESVGVPKSTLSKVSDGLLAPTMDRVVQWADRLELTGPDREIFIDCALVGHIPAPFRDRFQRLVDGFESVQSRLDQLEAKAERSGKKS